jgi:hypothetical protein
MEHHRERRASCEKVKERFLAWLDNDLTSECVEEIESHLSSCAHCAGQWKDYRWIVECLGDLEPLDVPYHVTQRIRARMYRPSAWRWAIGWIMPSPQRLTVPLLVTLCLMLMVVGVLRWSPWSSSIPETPTMPVETKDAPSPILNTLQASVWDRSDEQRRLLPGTEELLRPVKALEAEQERKLANRATLQDDLVLDISGSEEVFGRIEGILREVHGMMFLIGIQNRRTGRVIRSRIVLKVPMDRYDRVVQEVESLGHVHHLFMDRDMVPLPPDRLRIRILAVAGGPKGQSQSHSLEAVSHD